MPSSNALSRERGSVPHNLPLQLTSFIGREHESALKFSVCCQRPGCSRSRVREAAARRALLYTWPPTWWTPIQTTCGSLSWPRSLTLRLSRTLSPQCWAWREEPHRPLLASLTDALYARQLLLVLDNGEHLVAARAALADALLRACPHLRILATSREVLGIAGETTWRVPSLTMPDPPWVLPLDLLMQYEAVRLFVERATAVQSSFTMTGHNAAWIAQICHRLDGIPLAIELAATQVKVLSVEQLDARLDDRFQLLTGGSRTALPRQQALRATMDWSYDLLSEPEQSVWRRLSVFAGGVSMEQRRPCAKTLVFHYCPPSVPSTTVLSLPCVQPWMGKHLPEHGRQDGR